MHLQNDMTILTIDKNTIFLYFIYHFLFYLDDEQEQSLNSTKNISSFYRKPSTEDSDVSNNPVNIDDYNDDEEEDEEYNLPTCYTCKLSFQENDELIHHRNSFEHKARINNISISKTIFNNARKRKRSLIQISFYIYRKLIFISFPCFLSLGLGKHYQR